MLRRVGGLCTAAVLDVDLAGDRPYLAIEYVAGPTLQQHVREQGPLTSGELYGFAVGLAETLAAIHAAGVVHRDLTASNVLLAADGPKVVDFGIARHADLSAVTSTGLTIGTPGWMAPEQIRGGEPTPASDVFSWASLVVYAAVGESPFGGGAPEAVMYRIVHEAPVVPSLSDPLDVLVPAALAKPAEDRPTAAQLVDRLLAAGDDATVALALDRTWQLRPADTETVALTPAATPAATPEATEEPPAEPTDPATPERCTTPRPPNPSRS